jgi:hypothetical protein
MTILVLIYLRQRQLGSLKCKYTFTRQYCFSSSKTVFFNNMHINKYDKLGKYKM